MFLRVPRHAVAAYLGLLAVLLLFLAPPLARALAPMPQAMPCHELQPQPANQGHMGALSRACGYCDLLLQLPFVLWRAPSLLPLAPLPLRTSTLLWQPPRPVSRLWFILHPQPPPHPPAPEPT
ncbi:DUF2946 family protein [Pseudaeromonas paramecii]|uniref:DUF2946 domain-containing protein n=1 Tax=Pseudaeromonas paramecii TaxID=2138166 RepID=A0ABP8QH90_9GAMM